MMRHFHFKAIKILVLTLGVLFVADSFSEILPLLTSNDYKIKIEALAAHNFLRTRHHAPKLIWDEELQEYAQKYANKCIFAHSATPYGENLAAGYPSITAAINAWYAEGKQYSYSNPGFTHETGHFTQMVWVGSLKLGCGYVACNGRNGTPGPYLVCEYSPAGNITNEGYFQKNVLPAS